MASKVIRRVINSSKAPKAIGAYSQAVVVDKMMFLSGQIGLDPLTGEMVSGGVTGEAEQVMKNLKAVLEEAGVGFGNIVKSTILLQNISDFQAVNSIYERYFSSDFPARAAYQVGALPKGALVEIEAVAVMGPIDDQ